MMRSSQAPATTDDGTALAGEIAERIDAFAEQGITELAYQPCGPDIPRELEAFATAAGLTG